jgi:O-antigen/teichoic acid export membrane protein
MKNLLKAAIITGSAFLVNLIINLVRTKVVAVYLGPDGLAVFAQVNAFVALMITLSSLGLAAAIVRFIAEYRAADRKRDLKVLIATATGFSLLVSGGLTLILLLFTPHVATFIYSRPILLGIVEISLLNIPISVVTNLGVGLLQGMKEIKADAILSVGSSVAAVVITVGLLIPFGLHGAVVGSLIANYLTSAVFFYYLIRILNRNLDVELGRRLVAPLTRYFSVPSLRPLLGIAVASIVGGGLVNLADIMIRSHLINHFGLTVAGGVQPALSLSAQYTGVLSGAIGTYALPRLSELVHDRPLLQKENNDYIRLMMLIITPAAIGLAVVAKYIIPLLYTEKFLIAAPLVPWQSVADVAKFAYTAISSVLLALGRGKILLMVGSLIPLTYYSVYVLLAGFLGYNAIPIASAVAWGAAAVASYVMVRYRFDLHISSGNKWLVLSSIVATVAVAVGLNSYPSVIGIPLAVVIFGLWLGLNVKPEEWLKVRELVQSRLKRA